MANRLTGPSRHNYIHGKRSKENSLIASKRRMMRLAVSRELRERVTELFRKLRKAKEEGNFEGDIYFEIGQQLGSFGKPLTRGSVAGMLNRARAEVGNEDL